MNKFNLNINGKEVLGIPGQTILEVARENDIFIPTLCYDERTKIYGSCGLCMCEVEGNPKLCKACATEIAPGMVINTETERVLESRKTNLELLLSNHTGDCRPPCVMACPAHTDCQGYVGLIANGEFEKAHELIKDKIPLPAALGRVCPHPCEKECRRGLIDEPISIQQLKRFAADRDLASDYKFVPEVMEETGKSVAIIGGGPMGLSAAYFLRQKGHTVTIYDQMPKCGGMLRYGIPEYRLPKAVLDDEIATIEEMGVTIVNNTKVGVDIPFNTIREENDAVLLGIGAWVSTGVGVNGEDAEGVIGGIDFLRKVVRNEEIKLGDTVAIVGGGNTAMDACRTAIRLGAKTVYNIYRRTVDEMPADKQEIKEAMEEGVIFRNLENPLEILKDENGHIKAIVNQVMELGEPDASGRRKPIPVAGKTVTIEVDTMIQAIGQAVDASIFDLDKTKKGAIAYDKETFMTSLDGVFAGGDCGNDKISIAVEAIADAKKVSEIIDNYLYGEIVTYEPSYVVTRDDITAEDFEDRERLCRPELPELSPEERKDNFTEVVPMPYTEEEAVKEASRCLECGCHDYYECKLIDFANRYDVHPERFKGEKNVIDFVDNHPFIVRDPNKCILCGLCVRVCDEVMGVGALGLVNRGFDTVVKPNMGKELIESGCISCGQCVSVCPCGALQERTTMIKEVPCETEKTETTCSHCSVGCSLILESVGDTLVKAVPDKQGIVNKGLLCGKGKWGFDSAILEDKIEEPLIKDENGFREADYHEAFVLIAKKMQTIAQKYGKDSIAVSISDRYTNEEAYAIKSMAEVVGAKTLTMNYRENGLQKVVGFNSSPNTIDELLSTNLIVTCGWSTQNEMNNPVIDLKMKQAVEKGAQRIDICGCKDVNFLKQIAKAIIEIRALTCGGTCGLDCADFVKSLEKVEITNEAREISDQIMKAKKAMFVYQTNAVSVDTATMIGNIAVLSKHIGTPRNGILMVRPKNNSQGLVDLGIEAGLEELAGVKGLLVFGENADIDVKGLEFLAVCDTHMTELASKANVVIPGTGSVSTAGTFTNTERRMQIVEPAIDEYILFSNWEIAMEIANVFEEDFGWEDTDDISDEMADTELLYRYGEIGEVLGGVLNAESPKLVPVEDGKIEDILPITDSLMQNIIDRLPKAANPTENNF